MVIQKDVLPMLFAYYYFYRKGIESIEKIPDRTVFEQYLYKVLFALN
uniref:Uncharacterized protein n=1 Tax=Timema cristinae TaxID=61476 RepID=A0A7R9HA16_TIMCR|nr:unnamed protein product [Timema cristinae]